ncbi:MAG: NUDIX domain-containing protein [Verrucomicrobia bacterium]|nr:NUDIX domain-containing protein [Verrucomicrobiota bacterium]
MALPHKISTLLYCFNPRDEILLLERAREPNRGQWSPAGGKLKTGAGESPYACACREAREELALELTPADLHLTGLVSEHGYLGQAHWLMFLFEVRPRLTTLPSPIREGRFAFFPRAELDTLALPQTDREMLWPLFWQHRGGFYAAHCHVHADGRHEWTLEASTCPPMNRNAEGAPIRVGSWPRRSSTSHRWLSTRRGVQASRISVLPVVRASRLQSFPVVRASRLHTFPVVRASRLHTFPVVRASRLPPRLPPLSLIPTPLPRPSSTCTAMTIS